MKHCTQLLLLLALAPALLAQNSPVIIDSDAANELDDLYAIVHLFHQRQLNIAGLSSAHWNTYLSCNDSTLEKSHAINTELSRLSGKDSLPLLRGAEEMIGKPWGGREPRPSEASAFIIAQARALPPGDSLTVISLGAATNLASAILLAPDIIPRLRVYFLGMRYLPERKAWSKNEFNARNDMNALAVILETEGLDLAIMPASTAESLRFAKAENKKKLQARGPLGAYLWARWKEVTGDAEEWIMWDLALVQAMLHPEWAEVQQIRVPAEHPERRVKVYTSIDAEQMKAAFWSAWPQQ